MNYNNNYDRRRNQDYSRNKSSDIRENAVLVQLKVVLGNKDFCELSYEEIAKPDGIAENWEKKRMR